MSIYQGEKRVAENVTIDKSLYTMPVGSVIPYGSNTSPTGFLLCDGSEVSKEDYPDLYAVIGDSFGSATEGKFKLPDLRGKFVQGADGDLGTSKEAGLPNITGEWIPGSVPDSHNQYTSGAVKGTSGVSDNIASFSRKECAGYGFALDASASNSIYGNSTTVQPPAVCLSYIIKALKISDEPNDQYVTKPDLTQALTNYYTKNETDEKIPTKVSDLENDTEFITATVDNLTNYYKKTETYSQEEIQTLIGNLNHITISVVDALPTEDISTTTIYLIQISGGNDYDQYMYIDGSWAELGTTSVDLTNYATKDVATATSDGLMSKEDKSKLDGIGGSDYTVFMQDTQPAEDGLWIKGEEKDFMLVPYVSPSVKTLSVSLPSARYGTSAVTIDGKVYIFGGRNANEVFSDILEFDPTTNTCTTLSVSLPNAIYDTSAVAINGKAYIFGGTEIEGDNITSILEFDPIANTCTYTHLSISENTAGDSAAVFDNKAYYFTPVTTNEILKITIFDFDPIEKKQIHLPDVNNFASSICFSVSNSNSIYVLLPDTTNYYCVLYNPSSMTYMYERSYAPNGGFSNYMFPFEINDKIYALDLDKRRITKFGTSTEFIRPFFDTPVPMPKRLGGSSSVVIGNKVYVFGGSDLDNSSQELSDIVEISLNWDTLDVDGYYIKLNETSGKPTKISAHEISAVEKVYNGQTGGSVKAYSVLNGIATEL